LSSFIASTGIARLSTEPADADFFRPGTTIASFQWPAVCRVLSRQCGEQIKRVADLLVTHSAAGRSVVGVLGLLSGHGATTVAMCLAARLADGNRRVILVDGNFHRPRLATLLDVESTAGWQDVLKHGSPLVDAVIRATDDGFDLLALGAKPPKDPLPLVSGLQAVVTAGVLRHAYDHVLVDAGAFFDPASQTIVLELIRNMGIDAALAITGPSCTGDLDTLSGYLGRCSCELLGTIENRVSQESRVKSREPDSTSSS
jgi:Mrp family chromosome partitioning ATPase